MTNTSLFTILNPAPNSIIQAAQALNSGELVAFPTETVYGLGADATNDRAIANIFEAKRRPQFNPLIIHVKDQDMAARFAEFNALAQNLAQRFWPGALTLVLKRKTNSNLSLVATAGLDTVAVRVPAHGTAQSLLTAMGGPIAAPSANISGTISPTTADHVRLQFQKLNTLCTLIDGGPCVVGLESTIIDVTGPIPTLLRPGGISVEEIKSITGPLAVHSSHNIIAPGQMKSHYAPTVPLRMNVDVNDLREGESLLCFGPNMPQNNVLNLSPTGDLIEAAANLFAMMRRLDTAQCLGIAVTPIPNTGLGLAINDRLKRASTRP